MKGFKGKLAFYHNVKYDYLWVETIKNGSQADCIQDEEYIYLGVAIDVDVEFDKASFVNNQIEALEKQIEKERAESQQRINTMLGKINDLKALEAPE